jgi:phosphoglycerol transferase MdoB-like AlkP superfamily enzyme
MQLTVKNYYWRWSKNLFLLMFFFLMLMSLARVAFAWFFGDISLLLNDLALSREVFLLGLRYDLILLSYINIMPFLVLGIGYFFRSKRAVRFVRVFEINFLFLGYIGLFWLYVCDYGFYSYFQDRLNVIFFGFVEDDTQALLISIWKNYNLPLWLLVFAALHYGLFRLVKVMFSSYDFDLKPRQVNWRMGATTVLGTIFLFLAARGLSLGKRPLTLEAAFIAQDRFINILSLNGGITFARAIKQRRAAVDSRVDYLRKYNFENWQQAFSVINGKEPKASSITASLRQASSRNPAALANPPHVVLVVSEGFGSFWNEYDSKEFNILGGLGDYFKKGIYFKNFVSADNGTIGSFVSIVSGQALRPGARFLSESVYQDLPLESAGHRPFKQAGYETHFVYGGSLGWRNVGQYMKGQGYDFTWGDEEIKGVNQELKIIAPRDLGHEWGLYDEYLYSFIEERLRTATVPQFFLVLTTSNHPPFEVPSTYKPLPLNLPEVVKQNALTGEELARLRFLGLQYANKKFAEFLGRLQQSRLKDNTVVALTGDHSYWLAKGVGYEREFQRFTVPFFIMSPEHLRPASYDTERFGSHEDIFPTLYHLTLSGQQHVKIGKNLFLEEGHAVNSSGLVANKHGAYHHGSYWRWKDKKGGLLEPAEKTKELEGLKLHRNALITITDLYLKEEANKKPSASANDRPE